MTLNIQNFQNTARQAQSLNRNNNEFSIGEGSQVQLRQPLNPPGKWTSFKASLSNVPLLKNFSGIRQARAQMNEYHQQVDDLKISNRQVMQSFMLCLQNEFGPGIADMAMKDIDQTLGTPLTSRTVTRVMENVEQGTKALKAKNNFTMMRFLENSTTGGMRFSGEKDMVGLFLEKGINLHGKSQWQDGLKPEQAQCLEKLFRLKCQELPEYSKGQISNEQMICIANETLDFLKEIQDQDVVKPDELNGILANKTQHALSSKGMISSVRKELVDEKTFGLLDQKSPESLFNKTLDRLMGEMGMGGSFPDSLKKAIASDLTNEIIMSSNQARLFGCEPELKTLLPALTSHVKKRCEQAISGHLEALKMLDTLEGVSQKQLNSIKELANTQRMDTVQVEKFKENCSLAPFIKGLTQALNNRDVTGALEVFRSIKEKTIPSLIPCQEKARSMGCWTQFSANDVKVLVNQFEKVALAGASKEELQGLFDALTSPGGKDLLHAMDHAPLDEVDMEFRQLQEIQRGLVEGVGEMLGIDPGTINDHIARSEKAVGSLPPDVLLSTIGLTSDERGLDPESQLANELVKSDFNIQEFRNGDKQGVLDHLNNDPISKTTGLSATFHKDINRAAFRLKGEILPIREPEKSVTKFQSVFTDGEGKINTKLAKAVSLCMNQNGINRFMEVFSFRSVGGLFVGGSDEGKIMTSTLHDAFPDEDGNWFVTSSSTIGLQMVVNEGGETLCDLKSSVMVTSMTYKISKESILEDNPRIELIDSQHYLSLTKAPDGSV